MTPVELMTGFIRGIFLPSSLKISSISAMPCSPVIEFAFLEFTRIKFVLSSPPARSCALLKCLIGAA